MSPSHVVNPQERNNKVNAAHYLTLDDFMAVRPKILVQESYHVALIDIFVRILQPQKHQQMIHRRQRDGHLFQSGIESVLNNKARIRALALGEA